MCSAFCSDKGGRIPTQTSISYSLVFRYPFVPEAFQQDLLHPSIDETSSIYGFRVANRMAIRDLSILKDTLILSAITVLFTVSSALDGYRSRI